MASIPTFRRAVAADLPGIVALLADDDIGATREAPTDPLPDSYRQAFATIDADPHQLLVVATGDGGRVVGTLQLTFIASISYQGGTRAQIEAVRIARSHRGGGVGRRMIEWALSEARARGCVIAQLATDKRRTDARRFYESLGFVASHEGMKLRLDR